MCTLCKTDKLLNEFNKKKDSSDGLQPQCRDCGKQRSRVYYRENHAKHVKATVARHMQAIKRSQNFILEYLRTHPCVDCKEADILVLEFDHIKPKFKAIALMVQSGYAISRLIEEIAKCEVRCANCHRRKTYERGGCYRLPV